MRILLSMAALTLAAACVGSASPPSSRISPQTHEAVQSYSFLSCSAKIGAAEEQRIRAFLDPLGLRADDTLVVSVPKNRLPRRDPERVKTLNRIFSAYPAQVRYVQDEDLRVLPRSESTGIIRVVRTHGVAARCAASGPDAGCATARNLAAMIETPADTFMPGQGRGYMPATGARATGDALSQGQQ